MPFGTQDISLTQGLNRKPTILTVHMTVYSQQTLVDTGDHLSGTCKSLLCNALHQGRLCAVQHSMCPGNPVQRSSVPQTVEAWSDKSGLKNELSVSSSGAQPRRQQACTRGASICCRRIVLHGRDSSPALYDPTCPCHVHAATLHLL